ncbi:MAG: hypothetical protein BVN34_03495 [Proteobacteria bacterium ST_bin12]|nr:MAG: hypothetical protein BVN34_03495 [Proteobacteria bacterium ST_bin12]
MTDNSSLDSKIPVLTEVYQPKAKAEPQANRQTDPTLGITPELIARVTSHVRPRLEAEIMQAVLENLRDTLKKDLIQDLQSEVGKTKLTIEANVSDFVDKTKADLKTELPRMYQASADLVHASLQEKITVLQTSAVTKADRLLSDVMQSTTHAATAEINTYVEALKTETTERVAAELTQEMQAFQSASLQQQQTQANDALTNVYQDISEQAKQALQQHMQTIQHEALTQVRNDLNAAMPDIYAAAVNEVRERFVEEMNVQTLSLKEDFLARVNGHLPAVQEVLSDNIQQILASALPALEQDLRLQLTEELQQLLLKVKFVLP